MPKRIEARELEPFFDGGRIYVPFLAKGGRVLIARGDFDDCGPTETTEEVIRIARMWQKRPTKLDRKPRVVDSKSNPAVTAPAKRGAPEL